MINISEMLEKWGGTTKDCSDFDDLLNKTLCLDRNCLILDITEGTGDGINNLIRYWNLIDDKNNIPVEERQPIKLYIDSNGGDLVQTFIMIDSIRLSKTPVWTIGMGAVYSGGFFTFISGHRRIAYPSSSYLYHEGSTGTFGDAGKFVETSLDKELNMIDVNVRAYHILTKLFLIDFVKRNHGRILNVASMAGFMPGPYMATYYATKSYVLNLTLAIYEELKQMNSNVKISVLCPGPVKTNFNKIANVKFSIGSLRSNKVAKYAIDNMFLDKLIIVPSRLMKLNKILVRLLPINFVMFLNSKIQKRKIY